MQIAIHSSRIVGYDNNIISAICCRKQNGVANYYKLRIKRIKGYGILRL